MDERRSLSVVIPAYNEAARIADAVERARAYCEGRFDTFEIIVVDDGSTDGTSDLVGRLLADEPRLRLERLPVNRGKGAAVRTGMLAAKGDLMLMCDADLSAPIEEVEKLLPWLDRGFDMVIGSRAVKDSDIKRQPIYRHLMGKVFGMLARLFFLRSIRDPQCGFKLFTKKSAEQIFRRTQIDRFAFDVEVLLLARRLGYALAEVGICWRHSPQSRVRLFRDSFRMLKDLCRIYWYDRTGRYGA